METRRRELGIRVALGASRRPALVRLVIGEGVTLALATAAVSTITAYWAVPAIAALAPANLARIDGAAIDVRTFAFTFGMCLAVGLALAAYPALVHAGTSASASPPTAADRPRPGRAGSGCGTF